jgi:hypothetical protein
MPNTGEENTMRFTIFKQSHHQFWIKPALLLGLALQCLSSPAALAANGDDSRPNIVLILADDLGKATRRNNRL